MNIIRNNGFERGSTQFWIADALAAIVIDDTEHHRGMYSGKVTSSGAGTVAIRQVDYMDVSDIPVIKGEVWIKADVGKVTRARIRYYDADLNFISGEYSRTVTGIADWQRLIFSYRVPTTAVYALIQVRYTSAGIGEIFYIDDLYIAMLNVNNLLIDGVTVADLLNIVASGDTSSTCVYLAGYINYYADIDCTAIAGAGATLTVSVCEFDQHGNEVVLGTFAALAAVSSERINITPPIGEGIYLKYVEAGVLTDCDFEVYVTGCR